MGPRFSAAVSSELSAVLGGFSLHIAFIALFLLLDVWFVLLKSVCEFSDGVECAGSSYFLAGCCSPFTCTRFAARCSMNCSTSLRLQRNARRRI